MSDKNWMLGYEPEDLLESLVTEIFRRTSTIKGYSQIIKMLEANNYPASNEISISTASDEIITASEELNELLSNIREYVKFRRNPNT